MLQTGEIQIRRISKERMNLKGWVYNGELTAKEQETMDVKSDSS